MQEILQQENGSLAPDPSPATRPVGNRTLSVRHLRTGMTEPARRRRPDTNPIGKMKKERMRIPTIATVLALVVLTAVTALAQSPAAVPVPNNGSLAPVEIDRIIRSFTTKEAEFRKALDSYSFKRDALIQS